MGDWDVPCAKECPPKTSQKAANLAATSGSLCHRIVGGQQTILWRPAHEKERQKQHFYGNRPKKEHTIESMGSRQRTELACTRQGAFDLHL